MPVQPLVASGELFNMVKAALEEGSLAGCSFNTGDEGATESDRGDGILAVRRAASQRDIVADVNVEFVSFRLFTGSCVRHFEDESRGKQR